MVRWRPTARVAVLAGLVLLAGACEDDKKNAYVPPPPPKVTVAKPEVRTVTDNLEFTGNTVAYETVKLVARVEGYLQKIHFQDGQRVKKGDLLFTIQQDQYRADVEEAQSRLLAAQAKLEYSETEYQRFKRLYEQNAAAATQVDQWKYERDSAKSAVEAARANLVNAKLNLSYTTITAPFDGRMSRHLVDAGNLVGAGGQDTLLAEINRIDPIYVYFTINERDLLRVARRKQHSANEAAEAQDKPLLMGLSNEEGYPRKGVLDYAAITVNPQTGTLQLRGIFPNPNGDIVPGLFARIQAPYAQTKDALLLPAEAVGFDQQGRFVFVVNANNVVERRPVEVGEQIGELRVVSAGLGGDERVIVDGLLRAIPGRAVDPEMAGQPSPASPSPAKPPSPAG